MIPILQRLTAPILAVLVAAGCARSSTAQPDDAGARAAEDGCLSAPIGSGRTASVNGLAMYHEVHGSGPPLVLLHGAFGTVESNFGALLPALACERRVIVLEHQAHGRTADIDRTLTYEQMADDTAELLRQLGIARADFVGYSMGGATTLQIAARHPNLVERMVVVASGYSNEGYLPEILPFILSMDPDDSEAWASELREDFQRVAPHPEQWPAPVARVRDLVAAYRGLRPEQLRAIRSPALLVLGDRDIVPLEHAAEMFRLLPDAQLAIFPGTDHQEMIGRTGWLLSVIRPFLDAPVLGAP
jgi:pimeloyl-ACP methyl ester carboxylesterase